MKKVKNVSLTEATLRDEGPPLSNLALHECTESIQINVWLTGEKGTGR